MKIWIYQGGIKLISKSGIGKAIEHQKEALGKSRKDAAMGVFPDCEIVQLNTVFPDSVLVALLAKLMRKNVVYYAHSTMEDFKKSFKGSDVIAPLFKKWIKFCYSLGDVIVTPTEYSKKLLLSYGIRKEIINLSNGIDLEYYQRDPNMRSQFRKKYGFTNVDKVIISAGHYIERKGIEDFALMAERMPEYKFIWFGYTNSNLIPDKIKKLLELHLPNLYFPGYITKEELKEAYGGSDLFLFMTHEETEGIVLLEALAMRVPILVRDIPVYQSWLTDKKQVYKAAENHEFERLIGEIVEGLAPDLTEEGHLQAAERSIGKVGDALYDIYQGVRKVKQEADTKFKVKIPIN